MNKKMSYYRFWRTLGKPKGRVKTLRSRHIKYEYTQHIQWKEKIGRKWVDIPGATDDVFNIRSKRPVRAYITYTRSRIFAI